MKRLCASINAPCVIGMRDCAFALARLRFPAPQAHGRAVTRRETPMLNSGGFLEKKSPQTAQPRAFWDLKSDIVWYMVAFQ